MDASTSTPPASDAVEQPAAKAESGLQLSDYKKMFDDARTLLQDARADSELSRQYYDADQLTAGERKVYASRGQPPIVNNRIKRAIDSVMGVVQLRKTDPRALMRNPPDDKPQASGATGLTVPQASGGQPGPAGSMPPGIPGQATAGQPPPPHPDLDAGDVASMVLRYINDTTHFPETRMDVLENMLIEGCGAAVVEIAGQDVIVTQIRWEEFFYDPRSRRPDFKDARYMGVAKWMYADDVTRLYPEAKESVDIVISTGIVPGNGGASDETWEDRPNNSTPWVDGKLKRVMVVDMYHQVNGQWWRCVFYGGGLLEEVVSPYNDDKGQPANPIEAASCYVKGGGGSMIRAAGNQNDRYGLVKEMRDLQDEINMRRSKALHLVNSRQIQQVDPNTPPIDTAQAKQEAAKPDGVIPSGWNIVPTGDMAANNMELLAEAKSEIERFAPAPSILGRTAQDTSGRAQQINQQAGMTELARVLGRHSDWMERCYSQMWQRARQFYTDEKWVRVTDDIGTPQYVKINEQPAMDPMTGQPSGPPKNHIAQMDVDIILEEVPDTATLQQEQFSEIMQLVPVYGPRAFPLEIAIQMSTIPEKRRILDKLEAAKAAQAPQQQMQMQAQIAHMQADLDEMKSNTLKNNTQAGLNEVNTVVSAMEGHVKATAAAQLPPGYVLDGSGSPVPIVPPPEPASSAGGAAS